MTSIDWLAFTPAAFGVSIIPGANQLLGLRNAYRYGPRMSMTALGGRLAAFAIMIALVAVGLGALVVQSERIFTAIKWGGVAYLLYLGLRSLWSSWRTSGPPDIEPEATVGQRVKGPARDVRPLIREEFVVAATNPKAVLLFAALLPQFVPPTGSVTVGLLAVGGGYLVVEAAVASLYAVAGSRLRSIAVSSRVDRIIQRVTGVCLIGFAAALGISRRPV